MSDLQKFDPEAFYLRIIGNDSASEISSASNCSNSYVSMISEGFQSIMNLFRLECYFPPCPSPDFLETLDTSHSTHNVKIIAQNGVVTLKGPVHSEAEKSSIEQRASSIAGQSKVKNEIDVKP